MNDIGTRYVLEYGAHKARKKQHDLNTIENASMHIYTLVNTSVLGVIGRRLAPNPEIDLLLNCLFANGRSCKRRFIE